MNEEKVVSATVLEGDAADGANETDKHKQKVHEILKRRLKAGQKFWNPYHREWKVIRDFQMINRNKDMEDATMRTEQKREFQVALSFSTQESIEASIFDQAPTWITKARLGIDRSADYAKTLKAMPKALDYLWDEHELTERTAAVVHNFSGYGLGAMKVAVEDATRRVAKIKPAVKFMGATIVKEREVMETVGQNRVKLAYSVTNPFNLLIAPESKSLDRWEDIPWCIEVFNEEIDDAKRMLGSKDVSPTGKANTEAEDPQNEKGMERDKIQYATDTVSFFEYYGFLPSSVVGDKNARVRYHCKFTDKKLYHCEPIYHNDQEPPYELVYNYIGLPTDKLGPVVPFGDIKPIYHIEEEISESRAAMVTHRKRGARAKVILSTGDEVDEDALKSAEQDAIIRSDNAGAIKYLEPAPFDSTIINHINMARQDMSIVSGVDDLGRVATTEGTIETATGQRLVEAARSRRAKRKYQKIALFLERVGLKTLNRLAQYSPEIWFEDDFGVEGKIDLRQLTDPETGLINMIVKVRTGSQSSIERDILREQVRTLYRDTIATDPSIDPTSKQELLRSIWRMFDVEEADKIRFLPAQAPIPGMPGSPGAPGAPVITPAGDTTLPSIPGLGGATMDQSGNVSGGAENA